MLARRRLSIGSGPACREGMAQTLWPILADEFDDIAARLARDLRSAEKDLDSLRTAAARFNASMRVVCELRSRLSEVRSPQRQGFVYLIGHSSAVKIGWTEKRPERRRLSQLQSASSEPLEVLGVIVGPASLERELQDKFSAYWLRGEWFTRAEEILAYFAANGISP